MLQVPLPRVRNANDGGRKAISRFASLRVCLVQCQQAIADRRSLGSSHGFSFMFEFSWLTLVYSVHLCTHTHTHTRRVRICPELPQAGGPRVDADPTSFAETEESAEQEADDPTIQCQTICKFVRPTVAPTAD